ERMGDVLARDPAADHAGDPRGRAAVVRAVDRRLRHHLLQRRLDDHVPAVRVGRSTRRDTAADQRDRHGDLHHRRHRDARQHRVPEPPSPERGARRMIDLQQAARDHLWLHFTRMGAYGAGEVPIIVRGDGCYLEDSNGKRYLDGLAGLFAVQIGYSHGDEIGQAAHAQMRELPFYTNWSYAHPRAIQLAHEIAQLTPGDLNRVFFVSGGSEAVEAAWKLARQYHLARGERRWKAIGRRTAYHGTTMGALSINGIAALKNTFEPLVPETL